MDYNQLCVLSNFLDPFTYQDPVRITSETMERIPNDNTHRLCQLAFGQEEELFLSRNDLFRLRNGNLERFVLSVLFWGYPKNTRGRCQKAFESWDSLLIFANHIRHNPNMSLEDFEQLTQLMHNNIHGLGISTFSKLLYFSCASINGHRCIIIDDFEARGIAALQGIETMALRTPVINGRYRYYRNYPLYLSAIDDLATTLKIPAHNIEYTLWLAGKKKKKNM